MTALIDFAPWVRRRLKELKMSQRELGFRAGVDHSTVSRLLSEERKDPLLSTALKIVDALL